MGLNLSGFTFNGDQLSSVEQIQMGMRIVPVGDNAWCTKMTDVVAKKELAFFTPSGDNMRKMTGCTNDFDWSATIAKQVLDPILWRTRNKLCLPEIQNTVQVYAARQAVPATSLENTQLARILMNMMVEDIRLAVIRLAWINDTAESLTTDSTGNKHIAPSYVGGTAAITMNNGLWSAAKLYSTTYTDYRVTCSENSGTSLTGQVMTPDNAYAYMCSLVLDTGMKSNSAVILNQPDRMILCTRTVWNALQRYYFSKGADRGYMIMENTQQGGMTMSFAGVPVYAMDAWDMYINKVFDMPATTGPTPQRLPIRKGTEGGEETPSVNVAATNEILYRPHRAIFTARKNIILGVSNARVFDEIRGSYDPASDAVVMTASGFLDCQIAEPAGVRILY